MKEIMYNYATGEITEIEREMTPEEIAQMEAMQTVQNVEPQPTLEQRVSDIEQGTEEVITILNDKGIAP